METPKEKAIDIYNKFRNANGTMAANGYAKKQSIICVDEIINSKPCKFENHEYELNTKYWNEVKNELNKL